MFLLFLALSLFLLNFSLSKSYAKGFIQKCSLLRVKHYMLIGSSQCELALWTRSTSLQGPDVICQLCRWGLPQVDMWKSFLWSSLFSPEKVPIVFRLERWWVTFKPGCWHSGAELQRERGLSSQCSVMTLIMTWPHFTSRPLSGSPEHFWSLSTENLSFLMESGW